MSRILRFGLTLFLLSFAAIAVAAQHPRKGELLTPDAAGFGGDGPHAVPNVPNSAYPYYQTLKQYTFDTSGAPDPQGWTTHDLTSQAGVYWHVDDFSGLTGYTPLSGSKSMWCGVRTSSDPAYGNAPGYGDNWTQILESDAVPVLPGQPVGLVATMTYEVEQDYDFIYVEYKSNGGPWTVLATFTGAQLTPTVMGWAAPGANVGSSIQFRFVMSSDYTYSDENYMDTHGAVVVDDVRVMNATTSATYNFQNFESASLNATASGIWHGMTPPAFGNYAGLVSGPAVHQTGTPNTTSMWSFFNGSSATYACGGYPSQAAVPYATTPGSTRPGDYIANEVRSPWIDLAVDKNNQAIDPNMVSIGAEFDVYNENENVSNHVGFGVRCRFKINNVPQPWNRALFYSGFGGWRAFSDLQALATTLIPPGATDVQFGVSVIDGAYEFGGGATCHSQAPMIDNVAIRRFYRSLRVTNTNDSGTGSLRQAITNANNNPDFTLIVFSIPGAGSHTINLASPLPAIINPVWIDGFTQAGSIPNASQSASTNSQLMVAINGASAGSNANGLWFMPGGYGVVRGLAIGGFSGAGIRHESTSTIVNGCFIGTDGYGTTGAPNGTGIRAVTGGMDIGGPYLEERMLISNSSGDAIDVMAGECHIFNTHIGYDANGYEFANGDGIHVFGGPYCQIGDPGVSPCGGELTNRVWILAGNIAVDPAAQGVQISQVRFDGGYIDLNADGPTANDPMDADTGANGTLNFPVLTSVGATTIVGNMDGLPNQAHHIEFFSGDGFQNEEHYLGYQDVTTNGSGHANIGFSCSAIPPGTVITATATAGGNTSEFGPWITYTNTPPGSPAPLVQLYDNSSVLRATVQFDNVSSGGNTFLNPATPIAPNAQTWNVGQTPLYWDISTNAVYSGAVHIKLYYDPANIPGPENTLRLLHFQNGAWADVTDSFDFAANWIGGTVTSLSPFVIAKHTGATGVGDTPLPDAFALRANVPNPFNPATTISYDVRRGGGDVSIMIYDVNGRLVRTLVDEHRAAGRYQVQWNGVDDGGRPVSSGVYFYRMQAGSFSETRKMVLLK